MLFGLASVMRAIRDSLQLMRWVSRACRVEARSGRWGRVCASGIALGAAACAGAPRAPAAPEVNVPVAVLTPEIRTPAEPTPSSAPPLGGVFEGRLWTGGEMVPAETVLQLTPPSGSGSYWMLLDEQRVPGVLTDCIAAAQLRFTCQWHDRYGTGTLDLILAADQQRFEGMWWSEDDPDDKHPWLGTRLLAAVIGAASQTVAP